MFVSIYLFFTWLFGSFTEDPFTLATFNVRCPVDKTPHSWQERKTRCIDVIQKNRFDIFGVQEAVKLQLDDFTASGEYLYTGGGRNDFKNSGEFSAILYRKDRFELLKSGTFGLSEKPEIPGYKSWKTACPRIATWGLFLDKKSNRKFVYYNTHLDHKSEEARVKGIELLVNHAKKNMPGTPLIISGDFNAKPDSKTYQTASSFLDDSAKVSNSGHKGPPGTFHGYGKYKTKVPIDDIFVSKDFKVQEHWTDDTRYQEGFPSDHYPVIVKLILR